MLVNFNLSTGTCRAYIRTAAEYLLRHGAPPNMHHAAQNPDMKGIWADADKTAAGIVKRAAVIGSRFIRAARDLALHGYLHGRQHYLGLVLSFCFFLRISEFAADGDAAGAGPLLASDIAFFAPSLDGPATKRVLLPLHLGHLATSAALRVKGAKGDAAGRGAVRCVAQPDPASGIDLMGELAAACQSACHPDGNCQSEESDSYQTLLPDVNYQSYDAFIKVVARGLGMDTANVTSHIGRRSAATCLAASGRRDDVKYRGRWGSSTWERYIEECVHACDGVSDLMLQEFTFITAD
jgi:hypothetical protein